MPTLTPELYLGLCAFAFASSITPGPNNAMLLASGANFGVRRTAPHMMGVWLGFTLLILGSGLLLGGLFTAYPALHQALKIAGAIYLAWLAWKIATSAKGGSAAGPDRPMTLAQAALFQLVNVKGWAMALSAAAGYAPPEHYVANMLAVTAVFAVINLPCILVWTAFGASLRGWLAKPGRLQRFNWLMAALLAASIPPMFLES
ncbi:LysE family translocator [Phenylobacterium immobile]|uniref:LysE family translocator n=1 Tax=Phenylobacterium immobile TaxID=21 RepID=UPI000B1989B7|nr:LysE family translocator [Phenylobacterium immobile]